MAKGAVASALARFAAWRIPLLVGGGALVTYTVVQQRAAAGQARAVMAAAPAGSEVALTPEQTAALIAQGSGIGLQAMQAGLAPTSEALNLAGLLGQGAQGIAAASIGNFDTLANLAGQAIGSLPSFAPFDGLPAQPVVNQPVPIAPSPTNPVPTAPAPSVTESFDGYELVVGPGSVVLYSGSRSENRRSLSFARASGARCARVTSPWLQWRFTNGAYVGWHAVPRKSGPFYVNRLFRRSDGTTRRVNIGQTGS